MSKHEVMQLAIQKMDADDVVVALMLLKTRAAKHGLFRTVKAIDKATREVGWELAERHQQAERDHG